MRAWKPLRFCFSISSIREICDSSFILRFLGSRARSIWQAILRISLRSRLRFFSCVWIELLEMRPDVAKRRVRRWLGRMR